MEDEEEEEEEEEWQHMPRSQKHGQRGITEHVGQPRLKLFSKTSSIHVCR